MDTRNFKELPYTIELDWETGDIWLNIHTIQKKIVITDKDLKSINNCNALFNLKKSNTI